MYCTECKKFHRDGTKMAELWHKKYAGKPGDPLTIYGRVQAAAASIGKPIPAAAVRPTTPVAAPRPTAKTFDGPLVELDSTLRSKKTEALDAFLEKNLIGQSEAREHLVRAFERIIADLSDPTHPLATLLFLGPTGTGKTRIAELLSEHLHGSNKLLRVNCGEFQMEHEISKLIGAPPGYLGHAATKPYFTRENLHEQTKDGDQVTILLFDEVEKANDTLFRLLLGILDKAEFKTGDNETLSFSRTVVIMTSNLGASQIMDVLRDKGLTAETQKQMKSIAVEACRRKFSPEFFNRLDEIVCFHPLTREQLSKIVKIELANVEKRLEHVDVQFRVDDSALGTLLDEGTDVMYGARPLKRCIERRITTPVARLLSSGQLGTGDRLMVKGTADGFKFHKVQTARM